MAERALEKPTHSMENTTTWWGLGIAKCLPAKERREKSVFGIEQIQVTEYFKRNEHFNNKKQIPSTLNSLIINAEVS